MRPAPPFDLALEAPRLAPLRFPLGRSFCGLALPAMFEIPPPRPLSVPDRPSPTLPSVSPSPPPIWLTAPPGLVASLPMSPVSWTAVSAVSRRPLHDLGVLVERRECAVEDVVGVLEADLEHRLCVDVLEVDLDLVDAHVHTGHEVQQVGHLGPQGEMGLELPTSMQ